ncbi:hypothetical protein YC2023_037591 [Brassica napus]
MCSEQWLKADIKFCENVQTNEHVLVEVEMLDKLEKGSLKYVSGCVCTGTRNGLVLPASVLDHVNRVYKCFTLYCPLSITVSL